MLNASSLDGQPHCTRNPGPWPMLIERSDAAHKGQDMGSNEVRLHNSIDLPRWGGWMDPSHHSAAVKGRTELINICWASFEVVNLIKVS
ncbi:hypothetical protein CEXT_151511 [Caerostris extrusa]|uniref:Uncharacterized protein n=1 Tax=Caerostris extrusa TaxID=172846 RepID=A0AAV4V7T6_CAEEX|nr:hypothetical protein CEXT_151511 [Caerostris extrusa]